MIKVEGFRRHIYLRDELPEYQMERFISERGIKRDQIISITSAGGSVEETLYICWEER